MKSRPALSVSRGGDQPSRTTFRISLLIVARWLHPFGFVASLAFGSVFAYLTIVTARWLFGRKAL